jgi:hypothetical protein
MKTFPDFHKSRGTVLPIATTTTDDAEASGGGVAATRPYLLGGLPFIGAAATAEPLIGPKITWWLTECVPSNQNSTDISLM